MGRSGLQCFTVQTRIVWILPQKICLSECIWTRSTIIFIYVLYRILSLLNNNAEIPMKKFNVKGNSKLIILKISHSGYENGETKEKQ